MLLERARDFLREDLAIDRERGAGGDTGFVRAGEDERAGATKLFLQQADGISEERAPHGVRANELAQLVARLRGRSPDRVLLAELHCDPTLHELELRFAYR